MCPCWPTLSLDKVNGIIMNRSGESWGKGPGLRRKKMKHLCVLGLKRCWDFCVEMSLTSAMRNKHLR